MHYFGDLGDRDQAQQQYWRLRRHFGHRNFPRNPRLRAMIAELSLTEPPTPPAGRSENGSQAPCRGDQGGHRGGATLRTRP
jgi:hypothetical protein